MSLVSMIKNREEPIPTIASVLLVLIFGSMMFIGGYGYAQSGQIQYIDADIYILEDQYLGTLENVNTGSSDYLIMECSDPFTVGSGIQTFYFSEEHELRGDIQEGDIIQVNWAYIDGYKVIRGVKKA